MSRLDNSLSLCNGIGGSSFALNKLGVAVSNTYVCESDPRTVEAYNILNPNAINLGDIYTHEEWEIEGDLDILTASLPCQSYSPQGKGDGMHSKNGLLLYPTLDILRKYMPKYFFFENVARFATAKGDPLKLLLDTLEELGYSVQHGVVNSNAFSAQSRPRYYVLARRYSVFPFSGALPKFEITDDEFNQCIEDIMEDDWRERVHPKRGQETCTLREGAKYSEQGMLHIADAHNVGNYDATKRVYSVNGKAPTLNTCGGGHREVKVWQGDNKWCRITPLEMCRLQGFSDWVCHKLENEGFSDSSLKKFFGNSFQVDTVEYLYKMLFGV